MSILTRDLFKQQLKASMKIKKLKNLKVEEAVRKFVSDMIIKGLAEYADDMHIDFLIMDLPKTGYVGDKSKFEKDSITWIQKYCKELKVKFSKESEALDEAGTESTYRIFISTINTDSALNSLASTSASDGESEHVANSTPSLASNISNKSSASNTSNKSNASNATNTSNTTNTDSVVVINTRSNITRNVKSSIKNNNNNNKTNTKTNTNAKSKVAPIKKQIKNNKKSESSDD